MDAEVIELPKTKIRRIKSRIGFSQYSYHKLILNDEYGWVLKMGIYGQWLSVPELEEILKILKKLNKESEL